jgi:hypothetical protein
LIPRLSECSNAQFDRAPANVPSPASATLAGMPLAHPLTQPYGLPISPLVAAWVGAALVLLVAAAWPQAKQRSSRKPGRQVTSWAGSLSTSQAITRLPAVALVALAIVAGRVGVDDELENLAPALVVGAAWPLLVLASISLGPVWRWADPWDAVARPLTRSHVDEEPAHVWPAALVAIPWVWYLSAYTDTVSPRSVGAILALYTLFTVGGCLALGRVRWLATAEPLGIVLSWMALLPRGRLVAWSPPRGAEALLGVLAGGVLFGAVRRSELWGSLNTVREATLVATLGLIGSCAVVAGLLMGMAARAKRPGARPAVARAAVPALAGIIVAVAMDRNRLFTSVQLLPGLLGDPLGRGWDLFGQAGAGLDPAPLGIRGLLAAQIGVLLAGHLAGAVVLARGLRLTARPAGALALSILAGASVVAVASH